MPHSGSKNAEANASQARRILYIYHELLSGSEFSAAEIHARINDSDFDACSLRSIQRDLKLIQEIDKDIVCESKGKQNFWQLPKSCLRKLQVHSNELLSLYILKAHLKSLRNTSVAREIDQLIQKLEQMYPSQIVAEHNLFWDKSIGGYDYSGHDRIIERAIEYIQGRKWVRIDYDRGGDGESKSYVAMPKLIFAYDGYLYLAAYVPDYGYHIALAIHRIAVIGLTQPRDGEEVPPFDYDEFMRLRFGVFWGEPQHIRLRIAPWAAKYFTRRYWHATQQIADADDGGLRIEMETSVTPELVAWIMRWGRAIRVESPPELIDKVISGHRAALENY
ncbi:MAG: helix-turn-helix transcriptional regulator [Candidatus Kapaibacterium sp.]